MLTLQFGDVPVLVDESCARKLRRVLEDGEAVWSECYRVKTRVSEEVRLAFFESLFGGESRVPESDEDAVSLFTLCDEVGFSGFDHARRSRFDIGSSWTAEERELFFGLKALVDEHCERFEDLESRVAGQVYDLRARIDELEGRIWVAESGIGKSIDSVLSRFASFEESIGSVSGEYRGLRSDMDSITSNIAKLKASEREAPPLIDTGIGPSLKRALIDRGEWELYGSSVSVALKVPLVGVRRRRTCMGALHEVTLSPVVITVRVLGTSRFAQMVVFQKGRITLVSALSLV